MLGKRDRAMETDFVGRAADAVADGKAVMDDRGLSSRAGEGVAIPG